MSFDHRDSGTLESEWTATNAWNGLPRFRATGEHLVVVSAHPDDETLGAGGLIELACRAGARITVVVATDGEASHPGSPTHTPWQLSRIRRREMRKAVDHLAPDASIHHCGIADGELVDHVDDLQGCIERIVAELDGAATIVAPWSGDGHPDHRAASAAARAAAATTGSALLEYPIWMWHWGSPDDESLPWNDMVAVDLGDETRMAKSSALVEHLSQTSPLSDQPGDEAVIGLEMRRHFERAFEVFITSSAGVGKSASAEAAVAAARTHAGPADADADASDAAAGAPASLERDFFDDFYAGKDDPWGFETRWYERRKRDVLLASLPHDQYANTLEIGCSTGKLTAELARRSHRILGVDIAEAPLETASARTADRSNVELRRLRVPEEWPDGSFDLVVLSEVGYYWNAVDLASALDRTVGALSHDGVLVACHWRHPVAEYPLTGDAVHAAIRARTDLVGTVSHVEEDFVLEVFRRPPGISVARETGLLT